MFIFFLFFMITKKKRTHTTQGAARQPTPPRESLCPRARKKEIKSNIWAGMKSELEPKMFKIPNFYDALNARYKSDIKPKQSGTVTLSDIEKPYNILKKLKSSGGLRNQYELGEILQVYSKKKKSVVYRPVNLSNNNSGIYFMVVITEENRIINKIIKE